MATSQSNLSDTGNLGDEKEKLNLSRRGMFGRKNSDAILELRVTKLKPDHAEYIRKKLGLSGVIIIGYEDIINSPDKIKLVKSAGRFKDSSTKLSKIMVNILNNKEMVI